MVAMAESFNQITRSYLHDWVEEETRKLDVIASWESLCDTYRAMEFTNDIGDEARLSEFKWIIKEMNRHLARARTQLLSCESPEAMLEVLMNMLQRTDSGTLATRSDVVYQKLKQRWTTQMISKVTMMVENRMEEEESYGGQPDWTD